VLDDPDGIHRFEESNPVREATLARVVVTRRRRETVFLG
jgi:hypothetical protein